MHYLCAGLAIAIAIYWIVVFIEGSDNWIPIWTKTYGWKINGKDEFGLPYTYDKDCCYEILKSQKTGRLKIKLSGYKPKFHTGYAVAVEKLKELSQ